MTSCYSAKRPLVESEATLFFGSSPILVVAHKWLSVETLEPLGSWSNMEFRRVQSWVLSFTCYIQPTFQPYSPNTPHLVTSMLMMCRRSSMVHFLISSLLLAALMLSRFAPLDVFQSAIAETKQDAIYLVRHSPATFEA